jgi:hypothetical protein
MAEVCRNLYERYRNPSYPNPLCRNPTPNNCRRFPSAPTGKSCDRLIFADLYWGFKAIKLLISDAVEIPIDIPLTTVTRDITKVLSGANTIPIITTVGSNDHTTCIGRVQQTDRRVQKIFNNIAPLTLAMFDRQQSGYSRIPWQLILSTREDGANSTDGVFQ